jgi:L-threonylcarbamoyladenylate synthase
VTPVGSSELGGAAQHLRDGGVVAVATESFFGLLADPFLPRALDLLFEIKGRSAEHGVALMAPSVEVWRSLISCPSPLAECFARHFWPGPLTLVCPCVPGLDPRVTSASTVGVRVPGPCPASRLLDFFGASLTATSANLAGEPPCKSSVEVHAVFGSAVAAGKLRVIEGAAPGGQVSTLVRVPADGGAAGYSIVRTGAIGRAELDEVQARCAALARSGDGA